MTAVKTLIFDRVLLIGLLVVPLLLFIFYFLLLPRPAQAQPTPTQNCTITATSAKDAIDVVNKCAIEANIYDDKLFNLNQIAGTADSLLTLLTGSSQLHPETNLATKNSGALASSGKMLTAMYSAPPVSGVEYFAQQFRKVNPIQPAYAQTGIGFDALQPVQEIWSVFRNLAYVGFVIVFVIMGFMIMFRAHISPQAVATVQDSVPRIVVALILVTFSYAIAGLMIDIMFVFLNVVITSLQQLGVISDASNIVFKQSIFGAITASWKDVVGSVSGALSDIIQNTIDLGDFLKLDWILGNFGGAIAGIVVGVALLFIMFRVFFMLLMAYATIIILTMAAPFFFLMQALPGNNSARSWFQQMAANVAVFPVVAIMLIFAGILGGIEALGGIGSSAINEGSVGQFPLLAGDIKGEHIGKLIGIGFLLMTPSAAELVKNALGVKGGVNAGVAGAALAGAGGFLGSRVQQSSFGRAASDIMEHRGRTNAARLAGRVVTGPPVDPEQGQYGITRAKLPH